MTTKEHLETLEKVLNIKEYHDKGFLGQGIIVASVESSDNSHGSMVKDTVLTYAPEVTFISYNDEHENVGATSGYTKNEENWNNFENFAKWCVEKHADIVTSSLDWECSAEEAKRGIKILYDNGIIFCNCAGNSGKEITRDDDIRKTWDFDKEVVTVSGYMHDTKGKFTWAGFNYGEAVDVIGWGRYCVAISRETNSYYDWSGTSSATPMIAGMLATYKSANNNLNSKNVFDLINNNYIPLKYKDIEYKILKLPILSLEKKDDDVEVKVEDKFINEPEWSKEALEWAESTGLSDCTRLDDNVTRRELIVMLYRLFKMCK